jgi:hypothetical protein
VPELLNITDAFTPAMYCSTKKKAVVAGGFVVNPVGTTVGDSVGAFVGSLVGFSVLGATVGARVGGGEGITVGALVITEEGASEGEKGVNIVDRNVGKLDGREIGPKLFDFDGCEVGSGTNIVYCAVG